MSDDQSYYWTEEWQSGERETLAAYARGEGVTSCPLQVHESERT